MAQTKPTRVDYIIAVIGMIPTAVASIWRTEIAAWMNVAPKFVLATGVVLGVLIVLGCVLLLKKAPPRNRVSLGLRLTSLALLCLGVTYFLMREEMADLIGWHIRVGDGLMIFTGVATSMWLLDKSTNESSENP